MSCSYIEIPIFKAYQKRVDSLRCSKYQSTLESDKNKSGMTDSADRGAFRGKNGKDSAAPH